MKKIISLLLIFGMIASMFAGIVNVEAAVTAKVIASSLAFRSGPGTDYSKIASISYGKVIDVVDQTIVGINGCKTGWVKAKYENQLGYVCSGYISYYTVEAIATEREPQNDYEINWKNLGFPSSYWEGLTALKTAHPNYEFVPIDTGLDWATAVMEESSLGTSFIQVTDLESEKVAYISTMGGSYDYVNKKYIVQEGATWYAADSEVVAYYMDPRNFFNDTRIFMFENLEYTGSYITVEAINKVFASFPNLSPYAGDFLQAGIDSGINPVYLATLARQEIGSGTVAVSGGEFTYPSANKNYPDEVGKSYSGYYNFFNIGAGTDAKPVYNSLIYAKNKGWNSALAAITGGANIIGSQYIKKKQNTSYFKKFNVQPGAGYDTYAHQYMTNIQAPHSEASMTAASYDSVGLLASDSTTVFQFLIPVYKNMPEKTLLPTEVKYLQDYGNTIIDGLLANTTIKNNGMNLSGFTFGDTVEGFIAKINGISTSAVVTITDIAGDAKTTGKLVTGDRVGLTYDDESQQYTIVIYGDTSGDGDATILDLLQIQKHIMESSVLTDPYAIAADNNQDGVVNIVDLLREQRKILGEIEITG